MALTDKSYKDRMLSVLKELTEQSFDEFKAYLNDADYLSPHPPIPLSDLEDAERLKVAHLLISRYTKEKATGITLKILMDIRENDLAKKLRVMNQPQGVQQESTKDQQKTTTVKQESTKDQQESPMEVNSLC